MAQQKDVTNSQAIVKSFKIYHNTVKDFKSARESDAFIDIVDIYNSFSVHETILNPFITAGRFAISINHLDKLLKYTNPISCLL